VRKDWWWRWTVEKPAAFGDWLWLVLVVLPAEWLDRLTIRKIIALLPLVALVIAFSHNIPLPPEVVFLGDALAYLDILTIVLFLAAIGRASAILDFVRGMAEEAARRLVRMLAPTIRRADFRHRRANSSAGRKRRPASSAKADGDGGLIWLGAPA
jgi:hypothetical protein